ncbi:MAG: nuclear transport factor 2 family protein [Bacteroidetes bacterium]|nr:nuclear transport factor 2 family protein [Bacteroidota bacterium]
MKGILTLISILFLISTYNSALAEETKNQAKEIESITYAIDNCIGWFKEKDLNLLLSIVADDSNFISVHPTDKIVRGRAGFEKSIPVFMNPKFQYVRHEVSDLKITISNSGNVAWFYCRLNDINTWEGRPANWENARWTGVLEKREDRWQIVQQHFSFASE